MAAFLFQNYYYANTINRVEYCSDLGVDISPFRTEFILAHIKEMDMASSKGVYQSTKIFMNIMKSKSKEMIEIEISDLAEINNQTSVEVCNLFRVNGKDISSDMHVSKVLPHIHKDL